MKSVAARASFVAEAETTPAFAEARYHPVQNLGAVLEYADLTYLSFAAAFRQGLAETGHVEGRNVLIEYRWADEQYDRLPAMATDLLRSGARVIAANQIAVDAARVTTTTIPIVFTTALDPVAAHGIGVGHGP